MIKKKKIKLSPGAKKCSRAKSNNIIVLQPLQIKMLFVTNSIKHNHQDLMCVLYY